MFDSRIVSLSALFAGFLCAIGVCDEATSVGEPASIRAAEAWRKNGWPLMQVYCLDCHNKDFSEAELDLSGYGNLEAMSGGAGTMQRVLEMVRFGAMPPEDYDVPTDAERKQLVESLDQTLFSVSCDLRPRPGKVTARRLNRAEYNRSIRDLFGMDLRPADKFPSDEVGAGFDNNSDVLSMSSLLMEKYLSAAEEVADAVVVDPATLPKVEDFRPSDQLHFHGDRKVGSFFGLYLRDHQSVVWATFDVPMPGEYRVDVSAGSSIEIDTPIIAAVYDETGTLVAKLSHKHDGSGGGSDNEDFAIELEPGKRRFLIEFHHEKDAESLQVGETQRDKYDTLAPEWINDAAELLKHPLKPDRNFDEAEYPFVVRRVGLSGPKDIPREFFPPSQDQIVRRVAKQKRDKWYNVEESAAECLRPLMRRAFRGPVTDDEVKPYVSLVKDATDRGESYYRGLQIGISAILVSPRFLFRVETPPTEWVAENPGDAPEMPEAVELTQLQLATRLSYFLWSSLPDDTLLSLAEKGQLTEASLPEQVKRMLADEKSDALSTQFAAQWLGLRNLTVHEADRQQFGEFTDSLKLAMGRETESVFAHVVQENRPVVELLTADYTFVNKELAEFYELPSEAVSALQGDQFAKVSLVGTPRRGVLSHASVLTLTSNPNRTSPVRRGKWILENVLGTPPPEPPAGVPELNETKTAADDATFREQLELHRADPSCAACHRVMDQLGFGLEQFDAVGKFRTIENEKPVDASGELPGGRVFNGSAELSEMLGRSESESFAKTVTERLMTFALGRELTPSDRCTVEAIVERTANDGHRIVDLITEVVLSRPFRFYDWNGTAAVAESTAQSNHHPSAADLSASETN